VRVLGQPSIWPRVNENKKGVTWEFTDYSVEFEEYDNTCDKIETLSFTATNPNATLQQVLSDLELTDYNVEPMTLPGGIVRWRHLKVQGTKLNLMVWYSDKRILVVAK